MLKLVHLIYIYGLLTLGVVDGLPLRDISDNKGVARDTGILLYDDNNMLEKGVDEDRIIGGTESDPHSRPYQVALLRSGSFFCGGTLIAKQYVLTAAHCVVDRFSNEKFEVVLGGHNIYADETEQQKIEVEKRIKHRKYSTVTKENDIAIFKLVQPAEINENVNLLQLATKTDNFNDEYCTVSGWGTSDDGSLATSGLREVRVPIVDNDECNKKESYHGDIYSKMMCAGYANGGKDGCQGDSGGPLVCKNRKGSDVLVGVVSWGHGCAEPHYYGVYTKVNAYLDWIDNVVSSKVSDRT